jgi:hypothetical protein
MLGENVQIGQDGQVKPMDDKKKKPTYYEAIAASYTD